ncbi:D-alanyl-D-alanine carboxypeptidase (penicillin-binding protein 5/6) [Actinocorallia herbida]|uniref:D-alanyl-D-alanine carboxypeptidase (Penicillin-binding protein 5/6) n=1 Tax=Actinocorallia herbida TaxID=58109 RepID=A0A3N1D9C2_9ACTN|nr:D-alanyl-D-alanine carboxypeptidase [Actinocorallia herbida]ROO90134.1 D-alanyl-D-alanine carboxypeptidase (penicillin-binding protein 5/6) [Actinocorallia herbida]
MGLPLRAASALVTACMVALLTPGTAVSAAAPRLPGQLKKIKARSWIVADAETGEVLAAKNPHLHLLPASTQKVLTAVTLIPLLGADAEIRPTEETCYPEGTKVGMTPKLTYKAADLFRALLMVSANDAAMSLTVPQGGMKPTLDLMNAEAKRLGANDTLAGSPNGLDVDLGLNVKTQHTTSYDLAVILRQGLTLPDFVSYAQTNDATFPALREVKDKKTKKKKTKKYKMPIYSHIRMLPTQSAAYDGFVAGKNGYTNAAKQTFVGAAERDGHKIIIALMAADSLWDNAKALFDYGFANAGKVQAVESLPAPPGTEPTALADPGATNAAAPVPAQRKASVNLVLAGVGGGFVVAGGAILLVRRRRRPAIEAPDE